MRVKLATLLILLALPSIAVSAREGVPFFYQNQWSQANQYDFRVNSTNGFVGQTQGPHVIGQNVQSFQIPRATNPMATGHMTPNGIAKHRSGDEFVLSASYSKQFAQFTFYTGVNSILNWSDMIFDVITLRAERDFKLRGYELFAFGEYSFGDMVSGGMSFDFDLLPYDKNVPSEGLFKVSMGDMSGRLSNIKVGIGARHIWDMGGWKLSPIIGYQIFQHNLEMSNHLYPNMAVLLPLMGQDGSYIYGNTIGDYAAIAPGGVVPDGWYQVCMSPEDLALVIINNGQPSVTCDNNGENCYLNTTTYNPLFPQVPWGVGSGECVVVGGDGPIMIDGTTHIYNTTWSGLYLGLEIEKQMTFVDRLRFYGQISMPNYHGEGIWPNRDDWQQNPSFIDYGSNGSMHYQFEMEYIHRLGDRLELSLKGDMTHFGVGAIPGDLFVSGYNYYVTDQDGNLVRDNNNDPVIDYMPPQTIHISDSLRWARWYSFGLTLGIKYAF